MQWRWGLGLLAVAAVLWLGSMVADPYTSWGVEQEHVRPGVASVSIDFGLASLAFLLTAGSLVYSEAENRRGWRSIAFATPLVFLVAAVIYRLVWIRFVVLG